MSGNVFEWCWDLYDNDSTVGDASYTVDSAVVDPTGGLSTASYRLLRLSPLPLVVIRIYLLKEGDSNFPLEKCDVWRDFPLEKCKIGYATEFNWAVLEPVGFGLSFIETIAIILAVIEVSVADSFYRWAI